MRRGDLADLTAFVAVADKRSFRSAAERLGVTPSALSHTISQLERRLCVRLLQRSTRGVSLTDAGTRLLERLRPAIDQIADALEDLDDERKRPSGRLRIYATTIAASEVVAPIWAQFLTAYPEVQLELELGYGAVDIVTKGFDAAIGPREHAATDMVAVRVAQPMEVAVVGAPSYFAARPAPCMPHDLVQHGCVQYRWGSDRSIRKWAFECDGESHSISVDGPLIVNGADFAVLAAVDGVGIAYVPDRLAAPYIRSGQLIRVLDQWCPRNDALFLHYSGHRQVPVALRALIDMIRAARHSLVDPLAEEMHARTPAVATSPRHPRPNGVERAAQL